jgi:DnaK suppressor protein
MKGKKVREIEGKQPTEQHDKSHEDKLLKAVQGPYGVYVKRLLELRDRLLDEIHFHAGDNLKRTTQDASSDLSAYKYHMADAASDNFDREFSLTMVSNRQDVLYEVEEALERLENGTYGICEMSGKPIPRERLDVIPWARFTAEWQAEFERKNKKQPVRSFNPLSNDEEELNEEDINKSTEEPS